MNTLPFRLRGICLSWGGGSWRDSGDQPGDSISLLDRQRWWNGSGPAWQGKPRWPRGEYAPLRRQKHFVFSKVYLFPLALSVGLTELCCADITSTHPHSMRWIKVVPTRLRMAVTNAVTPFHLRLLWGVRSSIHHPKHGARLAFEPWWLNLWIQGWMGPQ